MITARRLPTALHVDWSSLQWVVLNADGSLWALSSTDTPWDDRQPFSPAEETELEPVPGHYKHMLGLPP
jgi:hypothetical protein